MRRAFTLVLLVAGVVATAPVGARAQGVDAGRYQGCGPVADALAVQVARASCDEALRAAGALLAAPPAQSVDALAAAGWRALRARQVPGANPPEHDIVALRGTAALRVRRLGLAPDLDGYGAGRELVFSRRQIIGGQPIPRDAAVCTSAFLVQLASGRLGGLSARHCAGLRRDGLLQRRNAALRRPPSPGIVLGRVVRTFRRSTPLDALVLPVPRAASRPAVPIVDRGVSRPPWVVTGGAQPTPGRRVCFSGRTSGHDRCGRILGPGAAFGELVIGAQVGAFVRCTTIRAAPGDSGGPLYTPPRPDGTVSAVGLVELIHGRGHQMCFTPLGPVLGRLHAALLVAG